MKEEKNIIIKKIKEAGVVGCGGAGFPSYFKYNAKAEYLLINGAECEPLLYKDKELMKHFSKEIAEAMKFIGELVGAKKAIIGLKAKNKEAIENFNKIFKNYNNYLEYFILDDFYPAGDEVVLVYEILKRVVPPAGLPLEVGAVVTNPETIINAYNKIIKDENVTETYITVAGGVKRPITTKVPIGITFREAIKLAGGATVKDPVYIDGGPMMGQPVEDDQRIITKPCSGFIVLDRSHPFVQKKFSSEKRLTMIGRSCCDQCSYCTELCPRYLLGHPLMPHKSMRSLGLSFNTMSTQSRWALVCVECGLCGFYSCPEDLLPNRVCSISKRNLFIEGIKFTRTESEYKPHPMRDYRKVPISKLVKKLSLEEYNVHPEFIETNYKPEKVTIPLQQHIGVPATPIVKINQKVKKGEIIGIVPDDKLGAYIHSSIEGKVSEINEKNIIIERV
ncbi:MAG TPA: SLBB domain-containing protein [bacterium]|nr:SLBB domain-containing protein [bacterium]HOL47485.1 SLBB domain-containing protein [bacterium]HPQ18606.1 SLBB domain-containing protein [bacterium]